MVLTLVIALAAASPESSAEKAWRACLDRTTTNYDWGQCGTRYVERADAALNAEWLKLMKATSGRTRTDLIAEERAWIAYRQNACRFYANDDWGREGHVLHYPGCVASLIEARTRDLADYLAFVSPK